LKSIFYKKIHKASQNENQPPPENRTRIDSNERGSVPLIHLQIMKFKRIIISRVYKYIIIFLYPNRECLVEKVYTKRTLQLRAQGQFRLGAKANIFWGYYDVLSSTWGWVSFINSAPINILTWPQDGPNNLKVALSLVSPICKPWGRVRVCKSPYLVNKIWRSCE
jgi:hypothetical protein